MADKKLLHKGFRITTKQGDIIDIYGPADKDLKDIVDIIVTSEWVRGASSPTGAKEEVAVRTSEIASVVQILPASE